MLTQWFEPEPVFKGLLFAKALANKGHEVQVLTGFPNYPEGTLYPGYCIKPYSVECVDGISVVRAPLYPSHDRSPIKRAANYLSFAFSSAFVRGAILQKPDIIYAYHPPATTGIPAMILKNRLGAPMVYDIQDMWPDSLSATKMISSPYLLKLIGLCCRLIYTAADKLVVLSPGFKKMLIDRGVPQDKIEVIYNWCEEQMIKPVPPNSALKQSLGLNSRFTVLFAGNMGPAQALDAVLAAAESLATRAPEVQFVFIGGGVSVAALEQKTIEMGLENVRFLPRRPMNEIGAILNLADVLFVHLRNDPLFEITIPSKTQAYMAMGKPIVMGVAGDAAHIIHRAGAGIVCEAENPRSIADAVLEIYGLTDEQRQTMGQRGRDFYNSEMSLATGIERFECLFQNVLSQSPQCIT